MGLTHYEFSAHALQEMKRRSIPLAVVEAILSEPDQVVSGRDGRTIYQSQVDNEEGKTYLVRVVVDGTLVTALVITVYRTSKIQKYWRAE
ncbi:MAG: DUF4258 domain-containing protein [Cyanobacteria bacterium]|nr:DUF4258 domain-containing protein [Cyanobacteriota bacterium]